MDLRHVPWLLQLLTLPLGVGVGVGAEVLEAPLRPVALAEDGQERVSVRLSEQDDGCFILPFATQGGLLWVVDEGVKAPAVAPAAMVRCNSFWDTPLVLQVPYARETIPYGLVTRQSQGACTVTGTTALEAHIAGHVIRLYDSDLDGRFGCPGLDGIRILGTPSLEAGYRHQPRLARTLALDGILYRVAMIGDALRLTPYEGPVAHVRLVLPPGEQPVFLPALTGASADLTRSDDLGSGTLSTEAEVVVPAGDYLIGDWRLHLAPPDPKSQDSPSLHSNVGCYRPVAIPPGEVRLTVPVPRRLVADGVLSSPGTLELDEPYLLGGEDVRWSLALEGLSPQSFFPGNPVVFMPGEAMAASAGGLGWRLERDGAPPLTGSLDYG